eukprot:2931287-Lingulodinium_polyedra.AAC.1
MQPMMRHRQVLGNDIIGSAYQNSVKELLYPQEGDWHCIELEAVYRRIKQHMPADLRRAWHALNHRGTNFNDPRAMDR